MDEKALENENRRSVALNAALEMNRNAPVGDASRVITEAKKIEAYLKGEANA
jgi:hypothetical protein